MLSSYKSLAAYLVLVVLITVFSRSVGTQQRPSPSPQTVPPIQLSVTVTNGKAFVTALTKENFRISIDKAAAKIVHFSNEDSPVSVGILLDASGSMHRLGAKKGSRLRILHQALASFSGRSNKANEYFLIGFNDKAELLADWTSGTQLIDHDIVRLRPFGETKLYDACFLGINKLQQSRHSKRVLILISDGQDSGSRIEFEGMRKVLRETGIPLYAVHTSEVERGSALRLEGLGILNELVSASGGALYTTSDFTERDVHQIFETIANELRNQFTIAIEPLPTTNEKKWHKIKVKISPPADGPPELKNLLARTREGYYSSQNSTQD